MLQEDIEEIELALGESKILTSWIPAWIRIKNKLKELAQQPTNKQSTPCPACGRDMECPNGCQSKHRGGIVLM